MKRGRKMANLNDLKRQHREIYDIIDFLRSNLEEVKVKNEASKLAQNINILAGKLKIHLISEDDNLYPKLLNGKDVKKKEVAQRFFMEMGNLSEVFTNYKLRYNISSKILNDVESYIKDTRSIINALQSRMNKEDQELYILLE